MEDPVQAALDTFEKVFSPTLEQYAEWIVEAGINLTGSEIGYFAMVNEEEAELTMIAWSRSAIFDCFMLNKPLMYSLEETGLWGDCVREGRAVITNDYEHSTRLTKKGYPGGHVPIRRHMNVPVHSAGRIVAVLGVGNKADRYGPQDAMLLQEFANGAWMSMSRVNMSPSYALPGRAGQLTLSFPYWQTAGVP